MIRHTCRSYGCESSRTEVEISYIGIPCMVCVVWQVYLLRNVINIDETYNNNSRSYEVKKSLNYVSKLHISSKESILYY